MIGKKTVCMAAIILLTLIVATLLPGCTSPVAEQKTHIQVFAASSLKDAFTEIKSSYEADHPDVNVIYNFDGSQQLRAQIEHGAKADVFASASLSHMNALKSEGLMNCSTVANFTGNSLAIITPRGNPAGISGMSDLANPGMKIAIGARDVPVGSYTLQVLDKAASSSAYGPEYRTAVMGNVVSQETSVSYVVSRVALGEADAGFVYVSDVPAGYKDKLTVITVPEDLNVVAAYSIGVVQQSDNPGHAREFEDFVRSAEGKAILEKYGFIGL